MLYVHSLSIGYGRMGVKWAENLQRMGIDVFDDLPSPSPADAIRRANERRALEEPAAGAHERRSGVCRTVLWASVPTHARGWWEGQRPLIATMWEATRLPESFRETLHHFDVCIVPSEQNVELFSQFHSNVQKVPLGVDTSVWRPTPRRAPGMFFDFLIGGSGARKGTDLAFRAFQDAFPEGSWGDGPIPRLIMKSPKNEPYAADRVEIVGGRISDEAEVALYEAAHCYLQPSRGEGFGLQPAQAIAQGLPTILTDAHGQAEFAHLGIPLGSSLTKANYFIYGDAGEWWEPDYDGLVDRMRWVYDHYEDACATAEANAESMCREFSWEKSTARLVDVIGDSLFEDGPASGELGEWFTPDALLYRVEVDRRWACEIAGTNYQFEPGRTYWEPADVKRILFDAGVLAPACLAGIDHGLAEEQVAELGDYSASHSYCSSCHQRLNSQPTRADDLLVAANG